MASFFSSLASSFTDLLPTLNAEEEAAAPAVAEEEAEEPTKAAEEEEEEEEEPEDVSLSNHQSRGLKPSLAWYRNDLNRGRGVLHGRNFLAFNVTTRPTRGALERMQNSIS